MKRFESQFTVNERRYEATVNDPEACYGLPNTVHYCKSCVISNQRPNSSVEFAHTRESLKETIHFDDQGVCDACRVAERKRKGIDWAARDAELRAICDKFRGTGVQYDCLVPGSGGKDSFYAAHKLKYEYGMSPLTVTWAPHIYTDWGWRNHRSWIDAGFDNVLVSPNGLVHRLLTRLAVENLFHPFQPFILGQKNLAPKMAALYGIPIVFFSTGGHRDYHQVTDEAQYIDYDQLASVARLVKDVAIQAASLDHRLAIDKPKPDPHGQCVQ